MHYLEMMCHVPVLLQYDLDLCPQGQISVLRGIFMSAPELFYLFTYVNDIWHVGVIPLDDVSSTSIDSILTLTFDLRVKYLFWRGILISTLELFYL